MKRSLKHIIPLIISVLLFSSCYLELPFNPDLIGDNQKITINSVEVFVDNTNQLALCPIATYGNFNAIISINNYKELQIDNKVVDKSESYNFGEINCDKTFQLKLINIDNDTLEYLLKFTLLPTISITHDSKAIPDEPKIMAQFCLSNPYTNETIKEFCGIERRGGSANSWPKHSFGFELHEDYNGERNKNISLLGMNYENDWILDGLYSDKSCLRNRVSFKVWKSIQDDAIMRGYKTISTATKGQFVELFINKEYKGIYCLSEKVDGENLGLHNEQTGKNGYMYKCENWNEVSRFLELTDTLNQPLVWEGWEQKYPKLDSEILWCPLYYLVDFIVNSSNEEFTKHHSSYLVTDQFIDFYIFVNIIKGIDNVGQNLILINKGFDAPFYFCPWDLDATWGRDWSGKERDYIGVVTFKIIQRYIKNNPDMFTEKLANRWFQLRDSVITPDQLLRYYSNYFDLFEKSGAGNRESETWPVSLPDLNAEKEYLKTWIPERIKFLDEYYLNLLK